MRSLINLLILIAVGFGVYGIFMGLPEGVSVEGTVYEVSNDSVKFLEDRTYVDEDGVRQSEQEIFDEIFRMIERADKYILIDMFLFNDFLGTATTSHRPLSSELTDALVSKKENNEEIDIILITDPINEIYGGYKSPQIESLRSAGVEVVITDLNKLRDSNPVYSAFYRPYFRWIKPSTEKGSFANPFDSRLKDLDLGTYFRLLNFKANHRKVVMADRGNTFSALVTSANPHDGSSAHTNTALRVDSSVWKDILASELAVAKFSGLDVSVPSGDFINDIVDTSGSVKVQLLTEEKIRDKIIEELKALRVADKVDIAMFYLSERRIISELKKADDRGVKIRILLDPNKDAFGREKNGIPNRSVAAELIKNTNGSTKVRFCDTHGEQCHTKLILINRNGESTMIQGSANLTRRNLRDLNLETNILVKANNATAITDAEKYFEKVWNNEGGKTYSTEYETYQDESIPKTILYRFMEDLGTSSF
jgi:phosphatidylserine/phosphatidylglycerophosphate/cardiolipin synthase-like enzyme